MIFKLWPLKRALFCRFSMGLDLRIFIGPSTANSVLPHIQTSTIQDIPLLLISWSKLSYNRNLIVLIIIVCWLLYVTQRFQYLFHIWDVCFYFFPGLQVFIKLCEIVILIKNWHHCTQNKPIRFQSSHYFFSDVTFAQAKNYAYFELFVREPLENTHELDSLITSLLKYHLVAISSCCHIILSLSP